MRDNAFPSVFISIIGAGILYVAYFGGFDIPRHFIGSVKIIGFVSLVLGIISAYADMRN